MYATRVSQHVPAPPATVYRALLDPSALSRWRVPSGMTSEVHEFEPREGGRFRISLTYTSPTGSGKSSAHTDTYHGVFRRLVPDAEVVEEFQFESDDPSMRAPMTMTTTLTPVAGGTEVVIVHENIPDSIPAADNELGTRMALTNLAGLFA